MSYEDMICTDCHSGLMYEHPEFQPWDKCELCGFCRLRVIKDLHPVAFSIHKTQAVEIADDLNHRAPKGSNKYKRD